MPIEGGKPKVIATLFGGQGTINVPSWSPDSKKIAFVSYRHILSNPSFHEPISHTPKFPEIRFPAAARRRHRISVVQRLRSL